MNRNNQVWNFPVIDKNMQTIPSCKYTIWHQKSSLVNVGIPFIYLFLNKLAYENVKGKNRKTSAKLFPKDKIQTNKHLHPSFY